MPNTALQSPFASVSRPQVLLVEDDESLMAPLVALLNMSGFAVSTYSCGEFFLSDWPLLARTDAAQCILMDVHLNGVNGLEVQKTLRRMNCQTPIVFMSGQLDALNVNAAWREGAKAFLFKPFKSIELLQILEDVFATAPLAPQTAADKTDPNLLVQLERLTPRQREVLKWVANGQSNVAISSEMHITARTVKMHRAGIMQRLGLGHVADLVRFYERVKHLLDTPEQPPPAPRSAEPQRDWALFP